MLILLYSGQFHAPHVRVKKRAGEKNIGKKEQINRDYPKYHENSNFQI